MSDEQGGAEVEPRMVIERGTVVADRYVVSEVLRPWFSDFPDLGSVCLVIDAILDRPAVLYGADSARSNDLLDAARRSALLSDPRIPAVQDVGRADGIDYVVCERTGATGLTKLLSRGPLDPEAARALIGELATALVHAAKRGLHHLCLGPESVALDADGDVVVHGIAIDAAVADAAYGLDLESMSGQQQLREDSLAIVNLLYAALTAHWPGEESRGDLPLAERKNNLIVRADSITPGIPRDLEEFVSAVVTKAEAGPRSPSEIVRYLGQWDTRALVRIARTGSASGEQLFPSGGDEFSGSSTDPLRTSSAPTHNVQRTGSGAAAQPGTGAPPEDSAADAPVRRATPQQLQAALTRIGMTRPGTSGLAAGITGTESSPFDERMQMRQAATFPIPASSLDEAAETTPAWRPEDTYASYSVYASREQDANLTAPIVAPGDDASTDGSWAAQSVQEDTQAIEIDPSRGSADAAQPEVDDEDGSWFLGGMFTTREEVLERERRAFEREQKLQREVEERTRRALGDQKTAGEPAGVPAGDPAQDAPAGDPAARTGAGTQAAPAPGALPPAKTSGTAPGGPAGKATGKTSAKAPGSAAGPAGKAGGASGAAAGAGTAAAEAPPQADRKRPIVPILIAAGVLVIVIVLISILTLGSSGDPVAEETPTPEPTAEPTTEEPTAQEPAAPPVVVGVDALDPEGDGTENNDRAENVLPGAEGTWQTDRYNSAEFGNLKSGLGLVLELEEAVPFSTVDVTAQTAGGAFEIRVGDTADPEDATVVGSGEFEDGSTTVSFDEPASGAYVFLWITELPEVPEGFRAVVASVELS